MPVNEFHAAQWGQPCKSGGVVTALNDRERSLDEAVRRRVAKRPDGVARLNSAPEILAPSRSYERRSNPFPGFLIARKAEAQQLGPLGETAYQDARPAQL